jgi:hypothetical protein
MIDNGFYIIWILLGGAWMKLRDYSSAHLITVQYMFIGPQQANRNDSLVLLTFCNPKI